MKFNLIAMLTAFAVTVVAPAFAGEMDEALGKAPERIIVKVLEKDKDGNPIKVQPYRVPSHIKYSKEDAEKLTRKNLKLAPKSSPKSR